jgi:hypothetical protein
MSDTAKDATADSRAGRPDERSRERRVVLLVLVLLGLAGALLLLPGVFTVDEDNYLVWLVSLRAGSWHVPGTDGLPFSRELVFFDPIAGLRAPGPIAGTMPPLSALFALPFTVFGWVGLFLLNLLAWLATAALLYTAARRAGATPPAAGIGALAFALSGFSLEYAVGAWTHALAAFLCFAGFVAALHAAENDRLAAAGLAGLLMGLAAGTRYQNVVMAGLLGLVLLVLARRRVRLATLYGLGLALPLGLSSLCNHLRAGSWNPISKGVGYLHVGGIGKAAPRWDAARAFLAQVVDFNLYPRIPLWQDMGGRWTPTGALLLLSAVKKALLQSAPWITVVFVALVAAWWPRQPADAARRRLRAIAAIAAAVFAMFAAAGTRRPDGWSHNPRYLLELVPLFALALAFVVERARLRWRPLAAGAVAGGLLALVPLLLHPTSAFRQVALLYGPLAMALVGGGLLVAGRWRPAALRALAPALGVLLGWAAAVHVGDDLRAARALRGANLDRLTAVAAVLPDVPAALFAHQAVALGPLLFDRDLVIASTSVDQGRDAPRLIATLQGQGRRVFVLTLGMSPAERNTVLAGRLLRPVGEAGTALVEIGPPIPAR